MKLTNENYCAMIVQIHTLLPLENCDNVVSFPIMGMKAIVQNTFQVGDIGILFPTESQLSEQFCRMNNIYRHAELNKNPAIKGYIEDSRRVKAVKFRGNESNALFMPLESLAYLGFDVSTLQVGDKFNEIAGQLVCEKYRTKKQKNIEASNTLKGKKKTFERIDNKTFPEHLDSSNYFRNLETLQESDTVIITTKLHGSSGRFGHVLVRRELSWREKALVYIGVQIQDKVYDYVAGSRRVIKERIKDTHFYTSDIWNDMLETIKERIPKDYILYGEIIGWTKDGSPIQKGYTYDVPRGEAALYIYRISLVNQDGIAMDCSYRAMQDFCKDNGFQIVPFLREGKHQDFNADDWMNKNYAQEGYDTPALPADIVDEGVMIRREGILPYMLKAKCSKFLEFETKMLDEGVEDIESGHG